MSLKHSAKITVLVVDDEPELSEIIQTWLHCDDIDVRTATNAEIAMDILKTTPIQLLLSDIRMPSIDGISLLEQAKANNSTLEVLLMTAFYDQRRGDAMRMGAAGVIQKPFSGRELLSWIHFSVSPRLKPYFEKKLRFPVQVPARYGKDKLNLKSEGTVCNISLNGMLIATNQSAPATSEPVFIRFHAEGHEPLFLVGKTQWSRETTIENFKKEFGVDVTGSPDSGLQAYRRFVRSMLGKPAG